MLKCLGDFRLQFLVTLGLYCIFLMQGVDRNKHDVLNDLIVVQSYLALEDNVCGHTNSVGILEQFKLLLP